MQVIRCIRSSFDCLYLGILAEEVEWVQHDLDRMDCPDQISIHLDGCYLEDRDQRYICLLTLVRHFLQLLSIQALG